MLFEVASGQILLAKRREFERLHREMLIPNCEKAGIKVVHCLMAEVGSIGKFIDIYQYGDYKEYDSKTTLLEDLLWKAGYYEEIQKCISGSISVELMREFYSPLVHAE
jgi:hypothetical protein